MAEPGTSLTLLAKEYKARVMIPRPQIERHSSRRSPDIKKKKKKRGLLSIINHLPSTLEASHCGERSTAV
jgi:hypothetical protein